jgi:hypothetical protein
VGRKAQDSRATPRPHVAPLLEVFRLGILTSMYNGVNFDAIGDEYKAHLNLLMIDARGSSEIDY